MFKPENPRLHADCIIAAQEAKNPAEFEEAIRQLGIHAVDVAGFGPAWVGDARKRLIAALKACAKAKDVPAVVLEVAKKK